MRNLIIGKIVVGVNSEGTDFDCRVIDKILMNVGQEFYLFVRTDGTTFYGNFIKKIHTQEKAKELWNESFHKIFSDPGENIF